jgi:hypothetical protein
MRADVIGVQVNNEPISLSVAIGGLLTTGVAVVALFVPNLTPETQLVIVAFGNAAILTGSVLYARAKSTPLSAPVLPQGTEVTVVTPAGQPNETVTV